jgi:Arc/MetJ-type ribon-helix-helix transcriptional regulator
MCYDAIMMRTQIQLTEEQAERLRALARERGVSLSELVRQAVDLLVQTEGNQTWEVRKQRSLQAVGRFASGKSDVSAQHDRYLEEAFDHLR